MGFVICILVIPILVWSDLTGHLILLQAHVAGNITQC